LEFTWLTRVGVRSSTPCLSKKPPLPQGTFLSKVEYTGENTARLGGDIPIGTLFGEVYVLTKSERAPSFDTQLDSTSLGGDIYRRHIELYTPSDDTFPDFTRIYLIPDAPPLAIHAHALIDLHTDLWNQGEVMPDTDLIEKAQRGFGTKGIEYISEEMAKRLIFALQNEKKRLYNTDQYFGLGG